MGEGFLHRIRGVRLSAAFHEVSDTILEFIWPETEAGAGGLRFWGGVFGEDGGELTAFDVIRFSYSPG